MTNAPFILNVDCDMFANNPEVVLHAMCLLLGFDDEISSGYVQAPQQFYGALKDDPFGNQFDVWRHTIGPGMDGIQGAMYGGTGCFHRRKIVYGLSPMTDKIVSCNEINEHDLSYDNLRRIYGNSSALMDSSFKITTKGTFEFQALTNLSSKIPVATEVAACTFELNTCWGNEVGWVYGSVTEDILTGLRIQAKGWRAVWLTPDPPAFLGSAPTGGPACLTQLKRWSTGLLEILIGPNNPIAAALYKQLRLRQCLAYLIINTWALTSVAEFCYSLLPAYCLLANSYFLTKASNPEFLLPLALFTLFNIHTLTEYIQCGLSPRAWWNNQRMNRISSSTAFLFGFISVILKTLGISETVFELTRKEQTNSDSTITESGRLTFDSSPFFVPATALVLVHIVSLVGALMGLVTGEEHCWGVGELVCSAWVVLIYWPFVKGLFGKGSHGLPWAVVLKAMVLGSIFLQFCFQASLPKVLRSRLQ